MANRQPGRKARAMHGKARAMHGKVMPQSGKGALGMVAVQGKAKDGVANRANRNRARARVAAAARTRAAIGAVITRAWRCG